jgi:formate-nitrite transporter family protein
MDILPTPEEAYEFAKAEGRRRLSMTPGEQAATGFLAGVSIVFGIAALGIAASLVEVRFGPEMGTIAGALAFAIGLVFVVAGRTELFSENFFDPVAAAIDGPRRQAWIQLTRLWLVILSLNLVGGGILIALLTVKALSLTQRPRPYIRSQTRLSAEVLPPRWYVRFSPGP